MGSQRLAGARVASLAVDKSRTSQPECSNLTRVQGLYIAGSVFMNLPWGEQLVAKSESENLLTSLTRIRCILACGPLTARAPFRHNKGMADGDRRNPRTRHVRDFGQHVCNVSHESATDRYALTISRLSDLIGFDGYLNTTTPFAVDEHHVQYKSGRQYQDFSFGNTYNTTCDYPRFWNETGFLVEQYVTDQLHGCYDSEFDQYGDTEAFGVFPDWRRQLSKFASVQDRLREWHDPVRQKLENFYCMLIAQLDIDGYRYDKATQSTVDALGDMNAAMRRCARRYGKDNFFIPGEITGGNTFGSIYVGRGRQPDMLPESLTDAVTMTNGSADQFFIRAPEHVGLDAAAFHYTVYRTFTRFLGMDGNLEAGYDAPLNFVDMWNTFLLTNDMINVNTGEFDPRHMYGVTNQDVFRWPGIENGIHRQLLGLYIATLHMPGIPLLLWGEEQEFYILDNTADNYIFGRQSMSSATAWQDHGCYSLDSAQFYNCSLKSCHT